MKRWMAEIYYHHRTELPTNVVEFEELEELHDIVEHGPDWNKITQITVTLNRPSVKPLPSAKHG